MFVYPKSKTSTLVAGTGEEAGSGAGSGSGVGYQTTRLELVWSHFEVFDIREEL